MNQTVFETIVDGIKRIGRPLEIALLNYYFFEGALDDVLRELVKYQNQDGGFGHGLEPDFLNPYSSPMQCFTAAHYLRSLYLPDNHPMIKSLLNYLENTYQKETKRWLNSIPSNNDYPHASWWSYDENPQISFNPSASLAGFIFLYANPKDRVYTYAKEVIYDALLYLNLQNEPIEVHELRCLIDLGNDLFHLGEEILSPTLKEAFFHHIDQVIEKDEERWFTRYSAKPTSLLKEFPSFYSSEYHQLLLRELEIALQNRDRDGLWPVTWSWGEHSLAFEESKKAWKGIIALEYLMLMKKLNQMS